MERVRHSIGSAEYSKLITHAMSDTELKENSRKKLLRIFGILYYTGIRLNEISYITIGKLRELTENEGGVIYTPKKDKERMLYLSPTACKKLRQLIKDEKLESAGHHIVSSWNKSTTPMHSISLIQLVNGYMKQVLGAGYTSHSFRQGIITEMFAAGKSTKVIQEFIGHSLASTTLGYDRPTPDRIRNALLR